MYLSPGSTMCATLLMLLYTCKFRLFVRAALRDPRVTLCTTLQYHECDIITQLYCCYYCMYYFIYLENLYHWNDHAIDTKSCSYNIARWPFHNCVAELDLLPGCTRAACPELDLIGTVPAHPNFPGRERLTFLMVFRPGGRDNMAAFDSWRSQSHLFY